MNSNADRIAYCCAALDGARAHNGLSANDRAAFLADISADRVDDAAGWAGLVVYDMSKRCRSFTPAFLTDLMALGRRSGDLE